MALPSDIRTSVALADLARQPGDVARSLAAWVRGDRDEAVAMCLRACAREVHSPRHTLWVWTTVNAGGDAVWLLPVDIDHAVRFGPKGPVGVLTRAIEAAADTGAVPDGVRVLSWHGLVALEAPGADAEHEVVQMALTERQEGPVDVAVTPLDPADLGEPRAVDFPPARNHSGGLVGLAAALACHPVDVALALVAHGQPLTSTRADAEMVRSLRAWGLVGVAPADEPNADTDDPNAIEHDPDPRRRHARILLRRMLRMGKVGPGYHTADDHLYRGSPANFRKEASEVGEALIRAGLMGAKPSVGQRHVYLRREALPEIHALIERGEVTSPVLAALFVGPGTGEA